MRAATPPSARPAWQRRFRQGTRYFALFSIVVIAAVNIGLLAGLRFVWTDSLPRGVYFVHSGTIQRGRVVAACLPPKTAAFGIARGFIPKAKQCLGGGGEIAKIVAAVPGDRVRVSSHGVYIDGKRWPWSAPMTHDFNHLPLSAKLGTYRVPDGSVLLLGLNYGSWDGRYFGPTSKALVKGVAWPLWIERGDAAKELRRQYPIEGYLQF